MGLLSCRFGASLGRVVRGRGTAPSPWASGIPAVVRRPRRFHPFRRPFLACLQIAALVEGEYTADEAAAIGLTPPAELAAALDALA